MDQNYSTSIYDRIKTGRRKPTPNIPFPTPPSKKSSSKKSKNTSSSINAHTNHLINNNSINKLLPNNLLSNNIVSSFAPNSSNINTLAENPSSSSLQNSSLPPSSHAPPSSSITPLLDITLPARGNKRKSIATDKFVDKKLLKLNTQTTKNRLSKTTYPVKKSPPKIEIPKLSKTGKKLPPVRRRKSHQPNTTSQPSTPVTLAPPSPNSILFKNNTNVTINQEALPGIEIAPEQLGSVKDQVKEVEIVRDENGDEVKIFWIQAKFKSHKTMQTMVERLPRKLVGVNFSVKYVEQVLKEQKFKSVRSKWRESLNLSEAQQVNETTELHDKKLEAIQIFETLAKSPANLENQNRMRLVSISSSSEISTSEEFETFSRNRINSLDSKSIAWSNQSDSKIPIMRMESTCSSGIGKSPDAEQKSFEKMLGAPLKQLTGSVKTDVFSKIKESIDDGDLSNLLQNDYSEFEELDGTFGNHLQENTDDVGNSNAKYVDAIIG